MKKRTRRRVISPIFKVPKANSKTIVRLMVIGALQVGENGLRASEPGIYPKRK